MTSTKESIKRLADEQKRAWETEGKALADIAEQREFTADERAKFEALEVAYNAFDDRIALLRQREQIEARALEFFEDSTAGGDTETRSIAESIRAVLKGEQRDHTVALSAEEVRAIGQRREQRALSVGTASAGGNLVGKTFLERLIAPLQQFSGVYAAGAYQFITSTGSDLIVPREATAGAAAAQSEGTTITGTDPTFDQVTFKSWKYGQYIPVSYELERDALFDIEAYVTNRIGKNIATVLGTAFISGNGTTAPQGLSGSVTTGVTGATGATGAPSFDNLIDLQESVLAPYQANAAWVLSNTALAGVRKLKDSATGRYLWEPNGQAGAPSELLGSPVFRDPAVAAVGLSAKSIYYGDFSTYWLRLIGDVRMDRSDQVLFGADQIAFRGILYADARLVDASGIKAFVGGAS